MLVPELNENKVLECLVRNNNGFIDIKEGKYHLAKSVYSSLVRHNSFAFYFISYYNNY